MVFLSPYLLFALPLAFLPLFLHLRSKKEPVPLPTFRFLPRLVSPPPSATSSSRSLVRPLLLLIRILIGLLLVVALANPTCSPNNAHRSPQHPNPSPYGAPYLTPRSIVYLVDTSATGWAKLDSHHLFFDAIRDSLERAIRHASPWDEIAIVTTSPTNPVVEPFTSHHDTLLKTSRSLLPTFARHDFSMARIRATSLFQQASYPDRHLVVITSGLDPQSSPPSSPLTGEKPPRKELPVAVTVPEPIQTVIRDFRRSGMPVPQSRIVSADRSRRWKPENHSYEWTIQATLQSNFQGPHVLEVWVDGARTQSHPIVWSTAAPELLKASLSFSFSPDSPTQEHLELRLVSPVAEPYTLDNLATLSLSLLGSSLQEDSPQPSLLLVSADSSPDPRRDSLFFVKNALQSLQDSRSDSPSYQVTQTSLAPLLRDSSKPGASPFAPYDLLFLPNYGAPSESFVRHLRRFIVQGGWLFLSAGDSFTDPGSNDAYQDLLPLRLLSPQLAQNTTQYRFVAAESKAAAAIGAPFLVEGSTSGVTRYLPLLEGLSSTPVEILLRYASGEPAFVARRIGRGGVAFFNSTLDDKWTSFPYSPAFLPWLHESIEHLLGHPAQRGSLQPGEVVDVALDLPAEASDVPSAFVLLGDGSPLPPPSPPLPLAWPGVLTPARARGGGGALPLQDLRFVRSPGLLDHEFAPFETFRAWQAASTLNHDTSISFDLSTSVHMISPMLSAHGVFRADAPGTFSLFAVTSVGEFPVPGQTLLVSQAPQLSFGDLQFVDQESAAPLDRHSTGEVSMLERLPGGSTGSLSPLLFLVAALLVVVELVVASQSSLFELPRDT